MIDFVLFLFLFLFACPYRDSIRKSYFQTTNRTESVARDGGMTGFGFDVANLNESNIVGETEFVVDYISEI